MPEKNSNDIINDINLDNKKILVAEDVILNQDLVKHILQSWNIEVTIANNGLEVLKHLQQKYFDCILMDVQMPEMDGIEATQRIRQLEDKVKASTPVIALTADLIDEGTKKYIDAGMNDYLAKPYNEMNLKKIISKNLQQTNSTAFVNGVKNLDAESSFEKTEINQDKLYNLSMIESVSGGDKVFIKKMIVLFIEMVPVNVEQLNAAAQTQNWEQVSKLAHKLKSTIDSMAIKSIQQDVRAVEMNAKQKTSLDELPGIIEKIQQVINSCIEQLQEEIAEN
jgi:CheY-like chemotaxis protein